MKNRSDFPLYQSGIEAIQSADRSSARKVLRSPNLSLVEKRLLRARILFRRRLTTTAIQLLERASSPEPFFDAERNILLAHGWFVLGHFQKAVIFNTQALAAYKAINDRRGIFLSLYNLSVDYNRMGAYEISMFYIEQAEKAALGAAEQSLVLRAKACQLSADGNLLDACRTLEGALDLKAELNLDDRAALYSVAADIYFRAGRLQDCLAALEHLEKEPRSTTEMTRAAFDRKLVSFIQNNRPLPAKIGSWQLSNEFKLKWQLLRHLQGGEVDHALRIWEELRSISPLLYGENFNCLVDSERHTIFFTFLTRILREAPKASAEEDSTKLSGRLAKLHMILMSSSTPLRKEDLIEKIWDTAYDPKFDARFYKLIERYKHVSDRPVITANRTYSLGRSNAA